MNILIQQYFEIILLAYSFSFFMLSTVAYVLPKDNEQSSLLSNLTLIAFFAVLHGSHEFIDWAIFRYAISNFWLHNINISLILVSYLPLVEFGRRMFYTRGYLLLSNISLVYGFICCAALIILIFDTSIEAGLMIVSRLLVGFSGAVLTGLSLFIYAQKKNHLNLKFALQVMGFCFVSYGFSMLVLPESNSVFAYALPNYSSFSNVTLFPVQLVRAILVLVMAVSLTNIVRKINVHSREGELNAIAQMSGFNSRLEHSVQEKTEKLKSLTKRLRADIAEREKLAAEKEQFFRFFNFARDLQCIAGSDGYFKQVNPAFSETLGYSKQELLETPFVEFIVPEDRQKTIHELQKQLESPVDIDGNNGYGYVTIDFENRYFCKDGTIRWLSWKAIYNPSDELTYATARDITEAKKIEEKLQLADMVYQHSIQGILITDEQNKIIAANPAFTEITGYTLDDVRGKTPSTFKSGRHPAEFYHAMWHDVLNKGNWQGEIWDKRKNGEPHAKFLSINTIFNKTDEVHRYLALFSDITARKQYEDEIKRLSDSELNKAKREAEKANRAKSDFLSSMSHELRTPMNAVLGFAQLLEAEDLTEDQLDSVHEILTAGYHLMDLINEVLDLSKIEAGKLEINIESIDLDALLKVCKSLMLPLTARNNVKITDTSCESCHYYVMADGMRLKQVLLNLISNAVKYNRIGGSVAISCEVINPQRLRIKVSDTGNGLSELQLSKLFQPFERLSAKNSNIEGTGIGLLITKKLIVAMNGSIGVSSTLGEGSCFWVEMPLV